MNLEMLLDQYKNSPRLFQLADKLSFAQPQQISLKNLHGSSPAFTIAGIFLHPNCGTLNHVIVCDDAEAAAYMHNSLESLTGALNLFYYPSSFKNRKNFRLLNSSHVMLRTEALTKFAAPMGDRVGALITYPEALFEKVVLSSRLSANMIHIKTNDVLDVDGLMQKLVNYGFDRTDFVYEPGQFALRGGILDIYSFGNEKPYRIELFGNDVDSIRIVDPETQLSERKLLQVSIIPNVETQFETGEKVSLFDFLPANTVFWINDPELMYERIVQQEEDLQTWLRVQDEMKSAESINKKDSRRMVMAEEEEKTIKVATVDDFITADNSVRGLQKFSLIEYGQASQLESRSERLLFSKGMEFQFSTKQQPAFNRQFDFLIRDLKGWSAKGFTIYLFADNPRQLERLYIIFEDLKAEINFIPIPVSIHEGFIDEDLKVVCYTDHQVFQRYHKYKVKQAYNKNKALTLRTLRELQPGDYVTHIDHGVGVYSGLQKIEANGRLQEAVRIIYKDSDILYVNINSLHKISKYTGKEGSVPKVNKLGSDVWNKLKEKTKTKVKEIAFDLIKLYAQRKAQQGFPHHPDNYMQTELEASFI
ncbi:MAG: transcription-repair coupling factor, partial [Chitinophagaceae bacterium]|nr:transcription-repair coupling factor [Chitinophagaceae bacterium]